MCGAMQNQGPKGPDLDDPGTFFPGGYMPEKSRDMSADVTPLTIAGIPPGGMMGYTEDELYPARPCRTLSTRLATTRKLSLRPSDSGS